jgi:hypothetical protein
MPAKVALTLQHGSWTRSNARRRSLVVTYTEALDKPKAAPRKEALRTVPCRHRSPPRDTSPG